MQVVLTPASGGQPVVIGFGSATQQGALNIAPIVTSMGADDIILLVQGGVLVGITAANFMAATAALSNNIALES